MSQRNTGAKKEEQSQGSGFLSSLLLAGGAAAVGFLAHKLVSDYNETQSAHTSAQSAHTSRRSPPVFSGVQKQENVYKVHSGEGGRTRKDMRKQAFDSEVPDPVKCIICMENPREVIMNPCGHVSLCEDCGEKICQSVSPICPVCQRPIKEVINAYI
ncbi:RNA-binding protein MEX3D-like [Homalodisca vitripennis]|uniref:RNA-binding protein MEX3D-like n=1 Tax=Homalodisca vitripennis TaxID=197043 RepID=UPI001EE9B5DC|nr:RNA-binding protein MEX3D-like [Homalodisca vitripennis]KAG8295726.1 negative regulation of chemokine (C-C motif) ligand 5 production [Homalodisca vitripennis]